MTRGVTAGMGVRTIPCDASLILDPSHSMLWIHKIEFVQFLRLEISDGVSLIQGPARGTCVNNSKIVFIVIQYAYLIGYVSDMIRPDATICPATGSRYGPYCISAIRVPYQTRDSRTVSRVLWAWG